MTYADGARPRYQFLATRLREDIEAGRYQVGTLMPTEMEISAQYNVSRSTVREAIRRLQIAGLVSRRPGVGTRIESAASVTTYSQLGSSIEELFTNAQKIRMSVSKTVDVIADEDLAEILRCKPRQRFLLIEGVVRAAKPRSSKLPFYWAQIYVAAAYAGIRDLVPQHTGMIASLIERHYNEPIIEIRQEVTAVMTDARIAKILSVTKGTPALRFQRWYCGRNASPIQITISVRPTNRFTYCTRIRRTEV